MIIFAFTKTILNFMKQISTSNAPAAIGPYSQAIEVNGFVYTSGQLPIDPATGAFPEGGVQEQTTAGGKQANKHTKTTKNPTR